MALPGICSSATRQALRILLRHFPLSDSCGEDAALLGSLPNQQANLPDMSLVEEGSRPAAS